MASISSGSPSLGTKVSVAELDFTPVQLDTPNTFTQNQTIQGTLALSGSFAHTGTTVGFFGTAPVVKQAAVSGVNGATVDNLYGQLEADVIIDLRIKVNQLSARLRAYGLIP